MNPTRYKIRSSFFLILFTGIVGQLIAQAPSGNSTLPPMPYIYPLDMGELTQGTSQFMCSERDRYGRLYFGVSDMIMTYDGEDRKAIPFRKGASVTALEYDTSEFRMYVGGQGGFGYLKGTKRGDLKYHALSDRIPEEDLIFSVIWQVYCQYDKGGNTEAVWFNGEKQLFRYSPEEDSIRVFKPRQIEGMDKEQFAYIYKPQRTIWTQEFRHGMYEWNEKGHRDSFPPGPGAFQKLKGGQRLADTAVMNVLPVGNPEKGRFLMIGKHLFEYNQQDERTRFVQYANDPFSGETPEEFVRNSGVYGGTAWGDDHLFVNTLRKGVIPITVEDQPYTYTIHPPLTTKNGVTNNFVWDISTFPEQDQLVLATNKGVSLLPYPFAIWTYGGKDGLGGNIRNLERYKGRIWGAVQSGIFYSLPERNKEGDLFKTIPNSGIQPDMELVTFRNEKGNIDSLIISAGSSKVMGILVEKEEGTIQTRVERIGGDFPASHILHVPPGSEGIFLLSDKKGVHVMRHREGEGPLSWEHTGPLELPFSRIKSVITHPSKGEDTLNIWTAGAFKGVGNIVISSNDSILERTIHDTTDGVPAGDVTPMSIELEDGTHKLLLATEHGFLHKPDGKEKWLPFEEFPPDLTGGGEAGVKLVQGHQGEFWTQGTVVRMMEKDNKGTWKIKEKPFRSMGVGPVLTVMADPEKEGVMWFGGVSGLARFDRNVERSFDHDYSCMVTTVVCGRDSILDAGFSQRKKEEPIPSIRYRLNDMTFSYASPYYDRPDHLKYSYKLQGYDKKWSPWKNSSKATYTSLSEGSYTFKVKGLNAYGVESELGTYEFRILPPWYRTWEAYSGYSALGIGFIWLLLWGNGRRLRNQKRKLEKTVEERTREIREQKEKIERAHSQLQDKNDQLAEQKEELEKAHAELSETHKEITDSIDYAQKIQHALLQAEEHVSDHLPSHFILFKPQNVVSGDFYWAHEKNGYLYFASIDCTGHGVPGAFMSMLGISYLNDIISTEDVLTPGRILTLLRERIVEELSKGSGDEAGARDGMDGTVIRVPILEGTADQAMDRTIQFAGANSPLYVVRENIVQDPPDITCYRNGKEVSEKGTWSTFSELSSLVSFHGDRMAVGYEAGARDHFRTVEFRARVGDMLYMFSDGYVDQFGGPKGKKFRYSPFRDLLVMVHRYSMEKQKEELDRQFEDWRNASGQEQLDDVLVIGMKVE